MKNNREKGTYFKRIEDVPAPIVVETRRRVHFSEIDLMAFVWYGRYTAYFEEGAEALGRQCGLSYQDFYEAGLRAPLVKYHVDFFRPLRLDEEFTIRTVLVWNEGARLDTEYYILKDDGSMAAGGYTVQLFIDVKSGDVCLTSPALLERCRNRWKAGEFENIAG
jgi:acyl-CoA thioester hydrolase